MIARARGASKDADEKEADEWDDGDERGEARSWVVAETSLHGEAGTRLKTAFCNLTLSVFEKKKSH